MGRGPSQRQNIMTEQLKLALVCLESTAKVAQNGRQWNCLGMCPQIGAKKHGMSDHHFPLVQHHHLTANELNTKLGQSTGRSLTGKKSFPLHSFPKKVCGQTMCWRWAVGSWHLAVGDWRLVAVGGGWWRLVVVGGD